MSIGMHEHLSVHRYSVLVQVADFGLARDGFDMKSKVRRPISLPASPRWLP